MTYSPGFRSTERHHYRSAADVLTVVNTDAGHTSLVGPARTGLAPAGCSPI